MQRVVRSTLVGLLSLAGLTACGDKITNNNQTTTGVTPQVLSVTVTPSPASMNVGDSITFVATVTTTAGITDKTVTWSSSNTSVASVSTTGVVKALQAGTTTIIATSNADKTVSGASLLTVGGGGNGGVPTITVSTINQTVCGTNGTCSSVPANLSNVAGQVDVTFNVDAMGQKLQSVALVLNCTGNGNSGKDTVVATQTLSSSKIAAEAQSSPITLSFNTGTFNSATGAPAFKNGVCTVKGQAVTLNGTTPVTTTSASQQITLNNVDFVAISPAVSTTPTAPQLATATDNQGRLWHAGAVNVTAVPVLYSGNTLSSGTISLVSGPNATGVDSAGNAIAPNQVIATISGITPTNGVLTATFPNTSGTASSVGKLTDSVVVVSVTTVTSNGQGPAFMAPTTGTPAVVTAGNFIRLDNKAPAASGITAASVNFNTQHATNGWIGANFAFTTASGFIVATDAGITGAQSDFGGVDVVKFNAQYATAPTSSSSTWTTITTSNGIPETSAATAYSFRFQVCDALNNCANTGSLGTFGVDVTAPKIVNLTGPSGVYNSGNISTLLQTVTATLSDSSGSGSSVVGSGFSASTPLLVNVSVLGPSGATGQTSSCVIGTGSSVSSGIASCTSALTANNFTAIPNTNSGQYLISVQAIDQAGNTSAAQTLQAYVDAVAPSTTGTGIAIPASITTGSAFASSATDDMDVAGANGTLNYTSPAVSFLEPGTASPTGVTFDNVLTRSASTNTTLSTFYRALGQMTGTTVPTSGTAPSSLTLRATDAAGNLSTGGNAASVTLPASNISSGAWPYTSSNIAGFVDSTSATTVSFSGTSPNPASTTLKATVVAVNQTQSAPFSSVCFYYQNNAPTAGTPANPANGGGAGDLVQIGCTTTPPADVTSGAGTRTFTYSMSWTPASSLGTGTTYNLYAVGTNSNTDALMTAAGTTIALVK